MHLALLILTLLAAEQQRVAVLEFDASKAGSEIDRTYFSDLVRGAVHKAAPQLFVMTRESTVQLLKASGKKLEDCAGECEVETGKMLGADFVVSGRITKVGTRYSLTLRLHATASGELLNTSEARGKSLDALVDDADKAARDLVKPLSLVESKPAPGAGNSNIEPRSGLAFTGIPAGAFQFQGQRTVSVKAFRLGVTDVTVAAYAKCVSAGACAEPYTYAGAKCNWKTDRSDHPINCVEWRHAMAFCNWIGGRLPTEEEWEYAASGGSEGRTYPWGSEEPGARACWKAKTTCPAGSQPDESKWGLHDLAGNVWQRTSSDFDAGHKIVRGGSWKLANPAFLRARYRTRNAPSDWNDELGFRCAIDAG